MSLIEKVKKKKEFSGLPDSVVSRALRESGEDVKEARALLRKYFGVFLTNRVLKGKGNLLDVHISSKKRDYREFYGEIFKDIEGAGSVIDLGCGVNGFSYEYLPEGVEYIGIEAAGQLVEKMNCFFKERNFDSRAICEDLFDAEKVVRILEKAKSPRVVFMFQVVDALESMKRDFSKELISRVMENCEVLIISLPLVSLGGGKKFAVKRKWLMDFLESEFNIERDFEIFLERIICVRK
jgi:hypothetical protein